MSMGREKLPAAVPERQNALARALFLSKYLAVRIIPGVKYRELVRVIVFSTLEGKNFYPEHICVCNMLKDVIQSTYVCTIC